jgi:hypothetical protein
MLADRALAASLAGRLFTLLAYVGTACAIYLLLGSILTIRERSKVC